MNLETIGGTIIEAHLRFADQWVDLYGPGGLASMVELYSHGRWRFPDAARRTASAWSERSDAKVLIERDAALWSASDHFAPAIRDGLATWMSATMCSRCSCAPPMRMASR